VGVRRYQDLDAWRLANELKREVYALIENSPAREDRRFCDQIKAAASSGPANLAEGFGCYRHPEFARYARVARASLPKLTITSATAPIAAIGLQPRPLACRRWPTEPQGQRHG
jgi:hypothetical protein